MEGRRPRTTVVGYLPIYVPRELIHAAGMLRSASSAGAISSRSSTGCVLSKLYLRIPRSTIELGVSGRLDFVDAMLFRRYAT